MRIAARISALSLGGEFLTSLGHGALFLNEPQSTMIQSLMYQDIRVPAWTPAERFNF